MTGPFIRGRYRYDVEHRDCGSSLAFDQCRFAGDRDDPHHLKCKAPEGAYYACPYRAVYVHRDFTDDAP